MGLEIDVLHFFVSDLDPGLMRRIRLAVRMSFLTSRFPRRQRPESHRLVLSVLYLPELFPCLLAAPAVGWGNDIFDIGDAAQFAPVP